MSLEPPQTWFIYECHSQPCASLHDGVVLEVRTRTQEPPEVRCPMCHGVMDFEARETADADGYRPSMRKL